MSWRNSGIHLINPLWDANGGSERRTLHLYRALLPHRPVTLWSEYAPDPLLAADFPIRRIRSERLQFPKTGTFVFVGAYFYVGGWLRYALPRRIILVYNIPQPDKLRERLAQFSRYGADRVELVYASEMMKQAAGLPGVVEPSLIDIQRFVPARDAPARPFTVGRLSRDTPDKHHDGDPEIYRQLAAAGCRVRVMGGTCLKPRLSPPADTIELLPAGKEPAHSFLQGLDCFFYRTHPNCVEASGRVVTEAMACGLPVVCHRSGGYREYIDHGRNGFLFDSDEEALGILLRLKHDAALRQTVGQAARAAMEAVFSPAAQRDIAGYYLQ
jgi:glycosyltransferase involved in cell wall biosynthesis